MKTFKMTNGNITATFTAQNMEDARNEVLKFADCSKNISIEEIPEKIEFTRINNDVNGNPRYVCHYSNFITEKDEARVEAIKASKGYHFSVDAKYELAMKRAKTIGGKKFHNKQYGGGIVFQSYSVQDLEKSILELRNKSTH